MSSINHIALRVTDLKRSKSFYRKYLQLESLFEHPIKGPQFEKVSGILGFDVTFAVMNDGKSSTNLELVEFNNDFSEPVSSFNHIAFEVKDVDVLHKELLKDGVETISEPVTLIHNHEKIDGKRFFYFKDPDGNIIEVYNSKEGLYSKS